MEKAHSTTFRQPAYFTLWALWFLVTAGCGLVWAAVIYIWGTEHPVSVYSPFFGGLLLGLLQGLVLRRQFAAKYWWRWIVSSSVGWFCAMWILFFGFMTTSIGGGLNDTDTRGCGVAFCGLAGAAFGLIQALDSQIKFDTDFWTITNAFTWAIGGLVGGIVGFAIYGPITTELDSPEGV